MDTIRDFLNSQEYKKLIEHFAACYPVCDEIGLIEYVLLKEQLKQRQYVVEGFSCSLRTEKENAEWLSALLCENLPDIIKWIQAYETHLETRKETHPDGEFLPGEELSAAEASVTISVENRIRCAFAMDMIVFDILKNHPAALLAYYKQQRMSYAASYAKEIKKLYAKTFGGVQRCRASLWEKFISN